MLGKVLGDDKILQPLFHTGIYLEISGKKFIYHGFYLSLSGFHSEKKENTWIIGYFSHEFQCKKVLGKLYHFQ
jgi:hypothetical protein